MAPAEPRDAAVETLVTYLEMTGPPPGAPLPAPCRGIEVRRAAPPGLAFYRYLYDAVGAPWTWTERRFLSDAELRAIIDDPAVEVNVLWRRGTPAGYAELDRRCPPDIELAYFGLLPEYVGRGLGRYLLDWTVHHAWRTRPRRLWVHTCDLDHPRALAVYQKSGFRVYDRRSERVALPGSDDPAGHSSLGAGGANPLERVLLRAPSRLGGGGGLELGDRGRAARPRGRGAHADPTPGRDRG